MCREIHCVAGQQQQEGGQGRTEKSISEEIGFFNDFIYLFLDRGETWRKRKDISMCGCLSCTPYWGPDPQPRHVPYVGIKPATLWFEGQHSIH